MQTIIYRIRERAKARRHDEMLRAKIKQRERLLETLPVLPKYGPLILNIPQGKSGSRFINPCQLQATVSANLQTQSKLFTLPAEIRLRIYKILFGERTVHIVLFYGPELGIERTDIGDPVPQRWDWWHSSCYNNQPEENPRVFDGFSNDGCREVEANILLNFLPATHCKTLGRNLTHKEMVQQHKLAGLGWLPTCQIGYLEALPILYGSNTISFPPIPRFPSLPEPHEYGRGVGAEFPTVEMFLALSSFIPMSYLNLIRYLDLTIFLQEDEKPQVSLLNPEAKSKSKGKRMARGTIYHRVLEALSPPNFPNLRKLRLGIRTWVGFRESFPPDEVPAIRAAWLNPLQNFAQLRREASSDDCLETQMIVSIPLAYLEIFREDMLREKKDLQGSDFWEKSDHDRKIAEGMSTEDFWKAFWEFRKQAQQDWENSTGLTILSSCDDCHDAPLRAPTLL